MPGTCTWRVGPEKGGSVLGSLTSTRAWLERTAAAAAETGGGWRSTQCPEDPLVQANSGSSFPLVFVEWKGFVMAKNIYVGNLVWDATQDDLYNLFQEHGKVT